jgi:CHAD domain-containing protein
VAAALKPRKSTTRRIRRITRDRIESALERLGSKKASDASVHSARKELKKARATLRLLRDTLGESAYKRENAALRDAARPLSEVRDGRVLLDALSSLVKYYGVPASALPLGGFRRVLNRRHSQLRRRILGAPAPLRGTRKTLREARRRASKWHVGRHGWSVLGAGLKRTYSSGRDALERARGEPTNEHLHEWRKQTKYFWYQLQVFEPLWPGPIGQLAQETHKLADLLGDDHDLAVLRERVAETREAFPSAGSHQALLALIERCRLSLQRKAVQLGLRLYEEKPREFVGRMGKYWQDWRHQRRNAS